MVASLSQLETEHPPVKELVENFLVVRAIAPPDFHLQGEDMERFLKRLTEAADMEDFTVPIVLDPTNSETSHFSAPHPLGGGKTARDENGFLGWRDSWVNTCVYNSTRDGRGVQVTVVAHACGPLPTDKLLRVLYTAIRPAQMRWGMLSSTDGASDFIDYKVGGDPHFKKLVHLLWENPETEEDKVRLGQKIERAVLARRKLIKALAREGKTLPTLDQLLLKHELAKLQRGFGEMEGIYEQQVANAIIHQGARLDVFPYFTRYDELTDTEIAATEMESARTVAMVGGGTLPISAFLYAQKTGAHIFVVEQDPERAEIATSVARKLGLSDRVTIIKQKAEEVDYSKMDVVIVAAMALPKSEIFAQASATDFPRTIVMRTTVGDSRAFYPDFSGEDLLSIKSQFHHIPMRKDLEAESDGVFSLICFDSERVANLP